MREREVRRARDRVSGMTRRWAVRVAPGWSPKVEAVVRISAARRRAVARSSSTAWRWTWGMRFPRAGVSTREQTSAAASMARVSAMIEEAAVDNSSPSWPRGASVRQLVRGAKADTSESMGWMRSSVSAVGATGAATDGGAHAIVVWPEDGEPPRLTLRRAIRYPSLRQYAVVAVGIGSPENMRESVASVGWTRASGSAVAVTSAVTDGGLSAGVAGV